MKYYEAILFSAEIPADRIKNFFSVSDIADLLVDNANYMDTSRAFNTIDDLKKNISFDYSVVSGNRKYYRGVSFDIAERDTEDEDCLVDVECSIGVDEIAEWIYNCNHEAVIKYYVDTNFNCENKFALIKVEDDEEEVVLSADYSEVFGEDRLYFDGEEELQLEWNLIDDYIEKNLGLVPEYEIN